MMEMFGEMLDEMLGAFDQGFTPSSCELESIAAKFLKNLVYFSQPNLPIIVQDSGHERSAAKFGPILHDSWSLRLGENRSDQSYRTFGSYAELGY